MIDLPALHDFGDVGVRTSILLLNFNIPNIGEDFIFQP